MKILSLLLPLAFASATVFGQAPSAITPAPAREAVGVSSIDGITVSGADVLVTRNGNTEKLQAELRLENGVRVLQNGTIIGPDGAAIVLRPSQILTFAGKIMEAPVRESAPPAIVVTPLPVTPASTTTTTTTKSTEVLPATQGSETVPVSPAQSAEETARLEAQRRARAAQAAEEKRN